MNQPKTVFLTAALFIICLAGVSFAQNSPKKTSEPSFEVVLQIVAASNDATEKSAVPQSLSSVVKKMKSDFSFASYRLSSTLMQRVSNNGNIELKSVAYEANQSKNLPVFSEWSLSGLQNLDDADSQKMIQIQNFRFIQRVPIVNDGGALTYEPIGISNRFSLPLNTPTVVGSLTTSKPDELIFLVLTVKSAEK